MPTENPEFGRVKEQRRFGEFVDTAKDLRNMLDDFSPEDALALRTKIQEMIDNGDMGRLDWLFGSDREGNKETNG